MNETTLRNKQVKQALLKHYASKDVSVRGDRGTAYGWVKVKVELDKPEGCTCNIVEKVATWSKDQYTYKYRAQLNPMDSRSAYYCEKCLNILTKNQEKVDKLVYTSGAKFSHYYADDGYGTERAEVLTQVDIRT